MYGGFRTTSDKIGRDNMVAPGRTSPIVEAKDILSGRSALDFKAKSVIAADLDKTLCHPRSPIEGEMPGLLAELLELRDIAIVSGGSFPQINAQAIERLPSTANLSRLYVFSTNASVFHRYEGGAWCQVYREDMAEEERSKIKDALERAMADTNYRQPERVFGDVVQDRGTQITFAAVGNEAPIEARRAWDPDKSKRTTLRAALLKYIPEFQITIGANSSLDVTRMGVDKAYGIGKIEKELECSIPDIIFIGDALFENGTDYPVRTTGVDAVQVEGPEEGERLIRFIIDQVKT